MKATSVLSLTCVLVLLMSCAGGGGPTGTAGFTLDGEHFSYERVEFRIEVNPRLGEADAVNVIESGKPQPVRYQLRSRSWVESGDTKGIAVGWWVDTDDPMGALRGLVGKQITNDDMAEPKFVANFHPGERSLVPSWSQEAWLRVDDVGEDTVSGSFGGWFRVEHGDRDVELKEGRFQAPISKFYQRK